MDLVCFLDKHKIITTLGVGALSFSLVFGIKDLIEDDKMTYDLIGRALYKVAGDDGVLSTEEKVKFLKDLGLEYSVQEGQKLLLDKKGEFAEVYLDSSYVGTFHREALKKYVGMLHDEFWASYKSVKNVERD